MRFIRFFWAAKTRHMEEVSKKMVIDFHNFGTMRLALGRLGAMVWNSVFLFHNSTGG
jgi:hypothetical protein